MESWKSGKKIKLASALILKEYNRLNVPSFYILMVLLIHNQVYDSYCFLEKK